MTEENKTIKLEEKELKNVVGGEDAATYKYVFTDKDWMYENSMKTITIFILENVSTNDGSKKILCRKRNIGDRSREDGSGDVYYSASTLLNCYKGNGGVLNAM